MFSIFHNSLNTFRHQWHYAFGLSIHPSVRPKIWKTFFAPICWSVILSDWPWLFLSGRPSQVISSISWKTHGENDLKFGMLMYPDHRHDWLDFGHGLLISLILAPLWLNETAHIWVFWALSGEHLGVTVEQEEEEYFWCIASSSV